MDEKISAKVSVYKTNRKINNLVIKKKTSKIDAKKFSMNSGECKREATSKATER